MECSLHGYFAKFTSLVFRSNFAKLSSPHCYLAILSSWFLPLWQLHLDQFGMSTFPSLQLHITIWLFSQIVYLAELLSPLHLVDNLNKLQAAHNFFIFWAVQCLTSAKTSAPENQIALDFFFSHRLPRASPLLPSLSLSLSLSDLMALWSSRGALSKFKLPPKLIF